MCNILGSSIEFVTIARYRVLRYFRCHGMLIYIIIMFAWNKYTDYSFFSFFLIITVGSACKIDCKLQNEKNLWSYYSMLPHAQIFGEFFLLSCDAFKKEFPRIPIVKQFFIINVSVFKCQQTFFGCQKKDFKCFPFIRYRTQIGRQKNLIWTKRQQKLYFKQTAFCCCIRVR